MNSNSNINTLFQSFELQATIFNAKQLKEASELLQTPHLALVGRSNVGKSSLLNCLAGRKSLAKVSSTPGKTRSINFYQAQRAKEKHSGNILKPSDKLLTTQALFENELPNENIYDNNELIQITTTQNNIKPELLPLLLADLPGYGFAKCSHAERESWRKLMEIYFSEAPGLKGILLLLDCRIPPQDSDKEMARYAMSHRLPLLPVLTKTDKITQREKASRQQEWQNIIGLSPIPVSSKTRAGLEGLCKKMLVMLGLEESSNPKKSNKNSAQVNDEQKMLNDGRDLPKTS